MKKRYLFISIFVGGYLLIFLYSIFSGSLQSNMTKKEENVKTYRQIIKAIKLLNAEYQVVNGRVGGSFTFKIISGEGKKEIDIINNIIKWTEFENMGSISNSIIFCDKKRGIRISYLDKNIFTLEYELNLTECIFHDETEHIENRTEHKGRQ